MRERMEEHRAQSGVRGLPQADGSDRPLARELRRDRPLAHDGQRRGDRRVGAARGRHDGRRPGGAAAGAAAAGPSMFARNVTEMLLTYALGHRCRALRHAVRPRDSQGLRQDRLPLLVARRSASSRARRFSGGDQSHDDHEEGHLAPDSASRPRRRPSPCRCSTAWCRPQTAAGADAGGADASASASCTCRTARSCGSGRRPRRAPTSSSRRSSSRSSRSGSR